VCEIVPPSVTSRATEHHDTPTIYTVERLFHSMRVLPIGDGRPLGATVVVVVAAVVLVGSLLPVPTTASEASVVAPLGIGADKWVHAASYAVVAGLAAATRGWGRRVPALVAVAVAVAVFGAGVEVAQSFVPGRTASGADAVANAVGAAVGVAGWWLLARRRTRFPSAEP
jgi:VanZ family protein